MTVACPPCVLRSDAMLAGIARTGRALDEEHLFALSPALGWYARPYLDQLIVALPFSLGWPLYGLVLFGSAVSIRRRTVADRIVLAAVLPYLVVVGGSGTWMPRYLLPVLPWLAVLAARGLTDLARQHRRAAVALFSGAWVYGIVLAASQVAASSSHQQARLAEWIAAHPPPGSSLPLEVGLSRGLRGEPASRSLPEARRAQAAPGGERSLVRTRAGRVRPPQVGRDLDRTRPRQPGAGVPAPVAGRRDGVPGGGPPEPLVPATIPVRLARPRPRTQGIRSLRARPGRSLRIGAWGAHRPAHRSRREVTSASSRPSGTPPCTGRPRTADWEGRKRP